MLFGAGIDTPAGVRVTNDVAMRTTTYNACVRILSETLAAVPAHVIENNDERLSDGRVRRRRRRAIDHPTYRVLHDEPNDEQTSYTWKESNMVHIATGGNGYNRIEESNGGVVRQIIPLNNERRVTPMRRNRKLWYEVQLKVGGGREFLPPDEVVHVPGLGFDGLVGWSPLAWARRSIGLAVAVEDYGAMWFGNNARPSGVLRTEGELSDEAYKRLKQDWKKKHNKPHEIAILEEGLQFQAMGVNADESQFLATHARTVEDIARFFRIPLHMVAKLDRATFSNIEHQSLEFVTYTMAAWFERWTQELNRKLFTGAEAGRYYVQFNLARLLLADIKARFEAYKIAIENGWLNPDDVRGFEDMDPLPDGQGEIYTRPFNMRDAREFLGVPAVEGDDDDTTEGRAIAKYLTRIHHAHRLGGRELAEAERRNDGIEITAGGARRNPVTWFRVTRSVALRQRLMQAHEAILKDATARTIRREANALRTFIRRHLRRNPDVAEFRRVVEDFYRDQPESVAATMLPALLTFAEAIAGAAVEEVGAEFDDDVRTSVEAFAAEYATAFGIRESASRRNQVLDLVDSEELDPEELADLVDGRVGDWESTGPERTTRRELVRGGAGAFAIAGWSAVGVTALRWVTSGKSCPLCESLDGRVVRTGANFVNEGDTVEGDETTAPLTARRNIGHPPLHDGCDCMLISDS